MSISSGSMVFIFSLSTFKISSSSIFPLLKMISAHLATSLHTPMITYLHNHFVYVFQRYHHYIYRNRLFRLLRCKFHTTWNTLKFSPEYIKEYLTYTTTIFYNKLLQITIKHGIYNTLTNP